LRNNGDATLLNLTSAQVLTDENPPTHEQGTDRPGRAFQSVADRETSRRLRASFPDYLRSIRETLLLNRSVSPD